MKAKISGLALLVVSMTVVASAQSTRPKKDIPTIAKAAKEAIVTIVMQHDDKPIALGPGFLVRRDGIIVTNYHVIATGNVAVVKFADGKIIIAATGRESPQQTRPCFPVGYQPKHWCSRN